MREILPTFAASTTTKSNIMEKKVTTLKQFKEMSEMTHDNRESAGKAWSKSWGMAYWENVWFYREYTSGRLSYRSGNVIQRHCQYPHTEFYLDGKEISKSEFFRLANEEGYMERKKIAKEVKNVEQLKLFA